MAGNTTNQIELLWKFEEKAGSLKGMEKLDALLDGIEQKEKEIKQLRQSGIDWALKDAEIMEKKLKQLKEEYNITESIEKLREKTTEKKSFKESFKSQWSSFGYENKSFGESAGEFTANKLNDLIQNIESIFNTIIKKLEQTFKSAWQEFAKIVKSSYLTDSTTRENVLSYGMSTGESYALGKTMSAMGINSMEDLMWMSAEQQKMFTDTMKKYTDNYNKLYDKGFFDKQLKYTLKIQEFQDSFQMKIVEFFVQNQDTIMTVMDAILSIADWVISKANKFLGNEETAAIANSYSNNKNVKVDVSYNISGSVVKNDLLDAGTQSTSYLIEAINKGV